ncbi:MAG: Cof-type HAD-IIB family hydrolase [Lachnospiraceae bacterium]
MKSIKMIGLDLDGTLLKEDKSMSERSKEAIRKALAKGVVVLTATGRPYTGIPSELREFPGMRYILSSNGARIIDQERGKAIYESLLPKETAAAVLDVFEPYDAIKEIYFEGVGYANEESIQHIYEYMDNPAMAKYIASTRKPVKDIRKKMEELEGGLDKVQGLFKHLGDKAKALIELEAIPHIEVTGAISNNIEVNYEGVNKGVGLVALGALLGIERAEIMACGDGLNDLAMMKEVGFAVAMGNAMESIKKEADYVTGTNEEDGVAQAIEKFVLQ